MVRRLKEFLPKNIDENNLQTKRVSWKNNRNNVIFVIDNGSKYDIIQL